MKRSAPMKRTGFVRKIKPLAGILRTAQLSPTPGKLPKPIKRMQSTQRAVSTQEKALHDRMATQIGCIACALDGRFNDYVSIHHIDGRTKPDCHKKALPLCAGHHQDGTGEDKALIAVHPNKKQFEQRYGNQYELLALVMQKLGVPQ